MTVIGICAGKQFKNKLKFFLNFPISWHTFEYHMELENPTQQTVEREVLLSTEILNFEESYLQVMKLLAQQPATPVDWNFFDSAEETEF